MKPVAWMHPMTGAVIRASQRIEGVTLMDFDIPLYPADQLRAEKVAVLREAAEKLGYPVSAIELRRMADELEKS